MSWDCEFLFFQVVRSQKYQVAVAKGIPIFTAEWIEQLWELGRHENVKADDHRFLRHSCPAFKGLSICVSQMNRRDKDLLKKKIESHGGRYSGVLDMEETAILVTPSTEGDKYEYAKKWEVRYSFFSDCIVAYT